MGDEGGLRPHHILHRLARNRIGGEADEITGMALAQGGADLAVGLEAANAGAMAGARIDDDDRALGGVDRQALWRGDADQAIVDRAGQIGAGQDDLAVEIQHMGHAFGQMRLILVAALALDVGEQDGALQRVDAIVEGLAEPVERRPKRDGSGG